MNPDSGLSETEQFDNASFQRLSLRHCFSHTHRSLRTDSDIENSTLIRYFRIRFQICITFSAVKLQSAGRAPSDRRLLIQSQLRIKFQIVPAKNTSSNVPSKFIKNSLQYLFKVMGTIHSIYFHLPTPYESP